MDAPVDAVHLAPILEWLTEPDHQQLLDTVGVVVVMAAGTVVLLLVGRIL